MSRAFWGMVDAAVLTACGGYDADYDCEQSAACQERVTGQSVTDTEIDLCAEYSEEAYDHLSDTQQDYLDDVFDDCSDEESCAYIVCVCDYADSSDSKCEDARQHL